MLRAVAALLVASGLSYGTLPPLLHIDWTHLPEDRPVGTQDSFFGVLSTSAGNGSTVTVDRFIVALGNRGVQHAPPYRPGSAKMWNGGHSLPLSEADPAGAVWSELPHDSPATTLDRGKPGYSVNNAAKIKVPAALGGGEGLISAGGFAHHACNKQTVLLRDDLTYKLLPDFPYDNSLATVAAVGTTVYAIGGMSCPKGREHAAGSAWANSTVGGPIGSKVWQLDLANLEGGWKATAPDLPGTPRFMGAAAAIGTDIYVVGGETSAKNLSAPSPVNCTTVENCGAAALDNWKLDTKTMTWSRLPSLPPTETSGSCSTEGVVVWRKRYILCMGTDVAKYTVEHPSMAVQPRLGIPSQLNTTCLAIPGKYEAAPTYFNGVSVFDTKLSVFGSITSSGIVPPGCPDGLPINCFSPQVALVNDSMWVTGGECDPAVIGAKQYWHYPTVTLFGSLSLAAARLKSDDDDAVSQSVTRVAHHLKYMSYYGFDPPAMKGWVNLGLAQIGDGNCEVSRDNCNMSGVIDAWQHQQIPSLYGDLPIQWDTTPGAAKIPGAIFRRGYGLADGWESSLEALVAKEIAPQLGKSLRGVFLGDEICCGNATCWDAGLKPVTQKLRALLGPDAILYTNECANRDITDVPPELDLISVDVYAGYLPGSNGTDEVTAAKAMYDIIFPKLHPHQQVMLVPGTFACGNLSFFPLEAQAQNVVAKLRDYFKWAKADKRIAGFNPWHWETREAAQSSPPCDMILGAKTMPSVVAELTQIGQYILAR